MKYFVLTFLAVVFFFNISAQQTPIYNFQFINQTFYNPSQPAPADEIGLTLINKSYLAGIDGRPNTTFFSAFAPIQQNQMGIGLNFHTESLGITQKTVVNIVYSYKVWLDRVEQDHYVNFGIAGGLMQYSLKKDEMNLKHNNDPFLTNNNFNQSGLDVGLGLTYHNKNFQLGLSAKQLIGSNLELQETVSYTQDRIYIANASYQMFLDAKKDFSLSPMAVVRYSSNTELPQEAIIVANYKDQFYFSPSYKTSGAIGMAAAVNINGFKIGYAYDFAAESPNSEFYNGAHEIMIGYSFKTRKSIDDRINDRFDRLENKVEQRAEEQRIKDSIQDAKLEALQNQVDENTSDIKKNAIKIGEVEIDLDSTKQNLTELEEKLKKAGLLKESSVDDYDDAIKGYYLVVASVKEKNYSQKAMYRHYLSKPGFYSFFNNKTRWHYVYTHRTDSFDEALKLLKDTRENTKHKDAWIHILR